MTQLMIFTSFITASLILISYARSRKILRGCAEALVEWRQLCDKLRGQEELRAELFTPQRWRYLKQHGLSARSAREETEDTFAPRWLKLGGASKPALWVSYLPTASSCLPRLTAWSLVIPSLATSLGVIGTFFGIQSGLYEAKLDQHMGRSLPSSDQLSGLMDGAAELFSSMNFAFVTSLGGLSAALVSTLIIARTRQRRARYCAELEALQDEHFCVQSATQSVERLTTELTRFKREQLEVADQLKRRLDDLTRLRLLDSGDHQELVAEIVVQIDELLSVHLEEEPEDEA